MKPQVAINSQIFFHYFHPLYIPTINTQDEIQMKLIALATFNLRLPGAVLVLSTTKSWDNLESDTPASS